MKLSSVLLAASVLGNVALAVLVTSSSSHDGSLFSFGQGSSSATADSSSPAARAAAQAAAEGKIDPKTWKNLSAGNNAALVERLRAEGFPPRLVRAIVASQINESFAARRKALLGTKPDVAYWMPEPPTDPKTQAMLRDLSKEQTKMMKDLLGKPERDDNDPAYVAARRRLYGDISSDKIDQIERVKQDYNELRNDVYGQNFTMTPDNRAKLAMLDKAQREDIKALLSPQEYEDYQLRSSSTANNMRFQLSAFKPTEQEFRTIFSLQSAFDEQFNQGAIAGAGDGSQEVARQRYEAQKQLTEQIKAALGPERAADYVRSTDGNFQQISRVVERLDLPQDAAVAVWNLQKETEQRMTAVRQDRSLSPAARTQQMAAISEDVKAKVTATLGERGYDVYRQYGGNWMQSAQGPQGRVIMQGSASGGTLFLPSH